ncbi:LysE/ArgO family amino acid transporter [Kutzneria buriramensis]|uniref:Arginine exporter protein ArgO n=1 Tax=Kutzneria buriramensis TaxID=1045776 RepID=A0A3E0IBS9_9PSEU|nr:LysE family transporter [Kutzneria buriramensis]REH55615.1 arginine exporter protein ArgO [Kutzneria buriramensis]
MSAALVAGLVAGYGIAMPVGAVATYLVALTARTSLRVGLTAALGVATADGLYALISTLGGSALAPLIAPITVPLHWISAGALVVLAVRGAIRAWRRPDAVDRDLTNPARAYLVLLGVTMLNPITLIYFTALVLAGPSSDDGVVFVLAAFAASASWQALLAGGGALLGRVLTGPRGRLATSLASSGVITALAVTLLLRG